MCFHIRYNEILSQHIFSKANIPCVCLGAARRHRPSGYTGTKRTSWTDGEWRTKDRVESLHVDGEILSEIFWWNIIRLSDVPSYRLTSRLSPGCRRNVGPHRHHRPQRSSCMYLLSCLVLSVMHILLSGNDRAICVYFLSIREPRVTEEVRGRWCVAPLLINPLLSSVSLDLDN